MVRVLLLKHTDVALSPATYMRRRGGVEIEVIGILHTWERGYHLTGISVEHCHAVAGYGWRP